MPSPIDTATHVIQAVTQSQYETAAAQLDAYTAADRQPPLLSRVDDAANKRITYVQESAVDLGE